MPVCRRCQHLIDEEEEAHECPTGEYYFVRDLYTKAAARAEELMSQEELEEQGD